MIVPISGENGSEIVARLKRDLLPTLINGLMFWPVCDFLTYKVIPVHLQVTSSFRLNSKIYMYTLVDLFWNYPLKFTTFFLAAVDE